MARIARIALATYSTGPSGVSGEFSRFIACAYVDLELRRLPLVARCEAGMRTGDLHK